MKIKTSVTNATKSIIQENLQSHVETLQVQGSLLCLACQEKEDLLWKSNMFQLKCGTLKFMLNACIDTLPTPANLKRWKKSSSDRCKLSGNRGTSNHYLNCCSTQFYGCSRKCGRPVRARCSMELGLNPLINGLIQLTLKLNISFQKNSQ